MSGNSGFLSPARSPDSLENLDDVDEQIPSRAKDSMATKKTSKCVRFLTVMTYVLSVSMAAILLSLYYVFLWDPSPRPSDPETPNAFRDPNNTGYYLYTTLKTEIYDKPENLIRRTNTRIEEAVTFPFQLDDPFTENNTTEEDTSSNIVFASSLNDTDLITPAIKKNISLLVNILANGNKNENFPNNT